MDRLGLVVVAIVALGAAVVGANLLAQRVYPTHLGDGMGRRVAYRVIAIGLTAALVGILTGIAVLLDL